MFWIVKSKFYFYPPKKNDIKFKRIQAFLYFSLKHVINFEVVCVMTFDLDKPTFRRYKYVPYTLLMFCV